MPMKMVGDKTFYDCFCAADPSNLGPTPTMAGISRHGVLKCATPALGRIGTGSCWTSISRLRITSGRGASP
jgi:hypothetical protein